MTNTMRLNKEKAMEAIAEYIRQEKQTADYNYRICLNVIAESFQQVVSGNLSLFRFTEDIEAMEIPAGVEKNEVNYSFIFDNYSRQIYRICSNYIDNMYECLYCGELTENSHFCNSQCHAAYSNKEETIEEKQQAPSIDLQLFAGGFTQQAPSHILYAQESEEYVIRSFFDRPGHNCRNGYPSYIRQSGKNQAFSYIAGPFWSKQSARDILDLADFMIKEYHIEGYGEGPSPVSFPCRVPDTELCNSFLASNGKEHDASCKGGKMLKIWQSCKRHDGMMKKLKDVLTAKGFVLYKDWYEFGTSRQKMVWWIER